MTPEHPGYVVLEGIGPLSRRRVGTVVLCLGCVGRCGGGMDGLPGDFSGFFS
jgi:hypothetical protein